METLDKMLGRKPLKDENGRLKETIAQRERELTEVKRQRDSSKKEVQHLEEVVKQTEKDKRVILEVLDNLLKQIKDAHDRIDSTITKEVKVPSPSTPIETTENETGFP